MATDDSYLDPTNLNGKVQKHNNFKVELQSNKKRLDEVMSSGQELIESGHNQSEAIKAKLEEVSGLWDDLVAATEKKSLRLTEASQQQHYNRGIEDLEMHLMEIKSQLMNEGCGSDLTSVQNLQKKHALLEANIVSYQDRYTKQANCCRLTNFLKFSIAKI